MKVVFLNGSPVTSDDTLTQYIDSLCMHLEGQHEVQHFRLSDMKLGWCKGCWTCWWETPGRCIHHDDADTIFRAVINADLFLFASPLIAGFTTALLKRITDRLIVLVHPYLIVKNGESHHLKRYPNNPDFAVILQKEADTDAEDIDIVTNIYQRLAINFHAQLRFVQCIEDVSTQELAYVIDHS